MGLMQFIEGAFGSNIRNTRDPQRKFVSKAYYEEVNLYTKFTDSRTGKSMNLEETSEEFGIIDVQLIDFAGSIFLNKNGEISPGYNLLFHRDEDNNQTELLHHKYYLTSFIRQFKHQAAMSEYKQMIKHGEMDHDKFTEFRYICLKGRILMRMGKWDEAINAFENSFKIIESKFSEEDKTKLISERKNRLRSQFNDPNWDSPILDYDEIILVILYVNTMYLSGRLSEYPLISIITKTIELATIHDLPLDIVRSYQTRAEIFIKLHNFEEAVEDLKTALLTVETSNYSESTFELYTDLSKSLINGLSTLMNFSDAELAIERYTQQGSGSDIPRHIMGLVFRIDLNIGKGNIVECFKFLQEFKEYYLRHKGYLFFPPLSFSKYLFLYLLQGISLKYVTTEDEIREILDYLIVSGVDTSITSIYSELANIQLSILQNRSIELQEYKNIISRFEDLLSRTSERNWRYQIIITHYIGFIGRYFDQINRAKTDLRNAVIHYYFDVMNSPYILLAIKLEVLNKILNNERRTIDDWIKKVSLRYPSPRVEATINEIMIKLSDEDEIGEFITGLFSEDISMVKFNIIKEEPITI